MRSEVEKAIQGIKQVLKDYPVVIIKKGGYSILLEKEANGSEILCRLHSLDTGTSSPSKEVFNWIRQIFNSDPNAFETASVNNIHRFFEDVDIDF